MAKLKIVSIRDSAIATYMPLQAVSHIGGFVRAVTDVVNSKQNDPLANHPEDYILFELGEFDDETGQIVPVEVPVQVVRLIDLKKP